MKSFLFFHRRGGGGVSKMARRAFHPGFNESKKIALPLPPKGFECKYYKSVWGNEIQKRQMERNQNGYTTNDVIRTSHEIANFYEKRKQQTVFTPTSHNTPLRFALCSCRNVDYDLVDQLLRSLGDCLDDSGVFVNTEKNMSKALESLDFIHDLRQKKILESAFYGIFSNFADSIYIANNYLEVGDNYAVVANYPDMASQREVERSRVILFLLQNGKFPIVLQDDVNFEGEANVKFLPAVSDGLQMAICYESSRSDYNAISDINIHLKKLNVRLIEPIYLNPKKDREEAFYHLDCILNFSTNGVIQNFEYVSEFYKKYRKNGVAIVANGGFEEEDLIILRRIFDKIHFVNTDEDPLIANMVINKNGIVGGKKINKDVLQKIRDHTEYIGIDHPSLGGGGAHKCCSNVLEQSKSITIDEWINRSKYFGVNKVVTKEFVDVLKDHNSYLQANELNEMFDSVETKITCA